MKKELRNMRYSLQEMAEKESTSLYRLAWKAQDHGCSYQTVVKIHDEARELHETGYPERLLDTDYLRKFKFAFAY